MTTDQGEGVGLLGKAKTVRSGESISPEERERIQSQIDALFKEHRSSIAAAPEEYPNANRGVLLPLIVNALAVLVVISASGFLLSRSNRMEAMIVAPTASAISTEAAILSSVRESARRQISQREAEIARIRAQLQQLRDSEAAGDSAGEIAELERRLEELLADQQVAQTIADAAEVDEGAAFLADQLQSMYRDTRVALERGDIDEALTRLGEGDRLVDEMGGGGGLVSELAAVAEASTQAIRISVAASAPQRTGQPGAEDPLETVAALVDQANSRFDAGDREGALRLYRSAIEEIDAVAVAYQRLEELTDDDDSVDSDQVAALRGRIAELESRLRESRESVAELRSSAEQREVRVAAERRIIEEHIGQLIDRVEQVARERAQTAGVGAEAAVNAEAEPAVIDLLESKLALREVLESPTVEGQYPAAQEDFEAYLQSFGRQQFLAGWEGAVEETIDGIDSLLLSLGRSPGQTEVDQLPPAESLQVLFRRLDLLLLEVAGQQAS